MLVLSAARASWSEATLKKTRAASAGIKMKSHDGVLRFPRVRGFSNGQIDPEVNEMSAEIATEQRE